MLVRLAVILALWPAIAAAAGLTVTDGDTLRLGDERIRIENIDAPETNGPDCAAEAVAGFAAAERLREILAGGEPVIERMGEDPFRRTLARIAVNGRDVGEQLIAEGLARPWRGRREDWCAPGAE